jgi:hypothetical protein
MISLTIRTMSRAELAMGLNWAVAEGWNSGSQDTDGFL